jgi:hypothetical protein
MPDEHFGAAVTLRLELFQVWHHVTQKFGFLKKNIYC